MIKLELNKHTKLKEKDVKDMRRLYSTRNYRYKDLANMYNVSIGLIGSIIRRKSWRHV